MGMVVRTNTMANNAFRQLGMNNNAVSKSLEKLSSGFRINRAGDDASGLAISEKMKAQIKGLEQASTNSQDGISLIQTAEGALTEVHSMLNRMVELATKSANGTIQNEVDRENIQNEVNALTDEINRIGNATNFNGINLLDGTFGSASSAAGGKKIEVGNMVGGANKTVTQVEASNAGKSIAALAADAAAKVDAGKIEISYVDSKGLAQKLMVDRSEIANAAKKEDIGADVAADLMANSKFSSLFTATADDTGAITITANSSEVSLTDVKSFAADGTTTATGVIGAVTDKAKADASSSFTPGGNFAAKDFISVDGKVYEFVAEGGKTTKAGATAVTIGADLTASVKNLNDTLKAAGYKASTDGTDVTIEFADAAAGASGAGSLTLQIGDTNAAFNKLTVAIGDMRADALGVGAIDVSSQDAAGNQIDVIKTAINTVSMARGDLGAMQNRLEYTINNLDTTAENMTSANSRIRDTDMAKEMMQYTKMNVLVQSAQAMLAQANQQPQSILQLLQ